MESERVEIRHLNETDAVWIQIKDPSVVPLPDGTYIMYCTTDAPAVAEGVRVSRFAAASPGGPWQELAPAMVHGVDGPEVCAPSVVLEQKDENSVWKMYIQTSCFGKDGVIALASSADGKTFNAEPTAMTKEQLPPGDIPVVGLYDVSVSTVLRDGRPCDCMVFSGYRSIGCGDVYVSLREKGAAAWEKPQLALRQEEVPFHNRPETRNFEWGLEGAKVVQLADDAFLMVGVCFLDKGIEERGTRQRVFFAASATPGGPFIPMGTPVEPTPYAEGTGENGHPDTIDLGDKLGLLYQERAGEGRPWHLRYGEMDKEELLLQVRVALVPPMPTSLWLSKMNGGPDC